MKILQKTWVAVTITALMIVAAIGIGLSKPEAPVVKPSTDLDTSLNTGGYAQWIWDEAGVLSDATEQQLCLFNANWVERYDSLIAVAVVVGLHIWKRNTLLSIGAGTLCYMLLVQFVF